VAVNTRTPTTCQALVWSFTLHPINHPLSPHVMASDSTGPIDSAITVTLFPPHPILFLLFVFRYAGLHRDLAFLLSSINRYLVGVTTG
jgi:hypothetical protein